MKRGRKPVCVRGTSAHASRSDCFCGSRDTYFAWHNGGARWATFSETKISRGDSSSWQTLAEKNEICRRQAQEQKLHLFKRRRFIRDCVNKMIP